MNETIIHIKECDSTNAEILKLSSQTNDLKEGTLIYTDFQTAGKGQKGNYWESEQGKNITCSLILFPINIIPEQQFIISQLVSLAVKNILDTYTKDISIKWPNDIYFKNKKIGGILIENIIEGNSLKQSIIGIGLNINQDEFISDAPNPISLKIITGKEYNILNTVYLIRDAILDLYKQLGSNSQYIIEQYKSALFYKDGFHEFNDKHSTFKAKIYDVLPSGLLVLEDRAGKRKEYAFKEISYIIK